MHPAYSVILFTTASGAGYGLLALLGLVGISHGPVSNFWFGAVCMATSLGLISVGLLASTFHLGHPERAWRAFSQWRSSWLSREGVAAVATFVPAVVFGALWLYPDAPDRAVATAGGMSAILAMVTVYCTGMIYRSLPTIRQWFNGWVVPVYVVFAIATGASLLLALAHLFGRGQNVQAIITIAALVLAALLKIAYWRSINKAERTHTIGEATGLGFLGSVRQLEAPHTAPNYLNKEMGFRVARKYAEKLRRIVLTLLGLAIVLTLGVWGNAGPLTTTITIIAATAVMLAAIVERWLFFAEAEHVVNLYYGRQAA